MKKFFFQTIAWLIVVSLFHSHILGSAMAAPFVDREQGQGTVPVRFLALDPSSFASLVSQSPVPLVGPFEEKRLDQQQGRLSSCAQGATVAAGTLGGLMGFEILYIINPTIGGILNLLSGASIPPVPPSLWGISAAATGCAIPEVSASFFKGVSPLGHCCVRKKEEESSRCCSSPSSSSCAPRSKVFYWLALPFVAAGIAGKNLFVLTNAILPPTPTDAIPFVIAGGVSYPFFAFSQLFLAKETFDRGWRSRPRKLSPAEMDLHHHLTATFRKVIQDPAEATALLRTLQAVEGSRASTLHALIQEQHSLKDKKDPASQARLTELGRQQENLARTVDLLKLRTLYLWGSGNGDETLQDPPPPSCGTRTLRAACGGNHPFWDKLAGTLGIVAGSPSLPLSGFGFWYILTSFGIDPTSSAVLAAFPALPFGTYLVKSMRDQVQRVVRYGMGYNPAKTDDQITQAALTPTPSYRVGRTTLELFDWGRRILLALPAAMLAGVGMGTANIPWAPNQLAVLPLYMMAFGASLPSVAQDGGTAAALRFGKDEGTKAQLTLAQDLKKLADWVRGMTPPEAARIHHFMTTPPDQWFAPVQVVVEGAPGVPAHSTQTAQTPPISIARSPLDPQALSLGSSGGPTAPPLETGSRSRTPSPPESPPKESALNGPRRSPPRNPIPLMPRNSFGAYPDRDTETAAASDDSGLTARLLKKSPSPPQEGRLRKIWRALFGNKK